MGDEFEHPIRRFTESISDLRQRLAGFPADTYRAHALQQVLALRAARDPSVRSFRTEVLEGQLLAPQDVDAWVHAQAERDGTPSYWLSGVTLSPDATRIDDQGSVSIDALRFTPVWGEALDDEPSLSHRYLEYGWSEQGHRVQAVRGGGTLDRLRRAAKHLSFEYLWYPDDATSFVLTGRQPDASRYAAALADTTRRLRQLSDKHVSLAVFTAEHEGESLAARMKQWNEEAPGWAYERVTNFGWDSRQAVRRLVRLDPEHQQALDNARMAAHHADAAFLREALSRQGLRREKLAGARKGKRQKVNVKNPHTRPFPNRGKLTVMLVP